MRRFAATTILLPLAALAAGPWFGAVMPASGPAPSPGALVGRFTPFPLEEERRSAPARPGRTVCNCRTVDVTLANEVDNARIKTGDAKVENLSITYVSASYGDRDVDVDQEAEAISGDAVAGQLVGVDARGPGCVNVRVHATNRVTDSTLKTGDATAINRSVILLDPGVNRGDLDIDVEQEAVARSGDAIAGQVLGVIGGSRVGACGGNVDLIAANEVRDTKVETGEASFLNDVDIRTCAKVGCAAELAMLTGETELELCSGGRCRGIDREELAAALAEASERADDVEESDARRQEPSVTTAREPCASPRPSPTPSAPSEDPGPREADPEITPTPREEPKPPPGRGPGPSACPSPSPSSTPSPEPDDTVATSSDA